MIPVYPMDCGKEPCDNPLEITAEMSKLVMYVLNYAFDDVETVQKAIDDANKTVVTAAVKYVNFLLTKITNNVTSVTDYLGTYLENLLTEQQVMLNTVAPGLFDQMLAQMDKPETVADVVTNPAVVNTSATGSKGDSDGLPVPLLLPGVLGTKDLAGDAKTPADNLGTGNDSVFTTNQGGSKFQDIVTPQMSPENGVTVGIGVDSTIGGNGESVPLPDVNGKPVTANEVVRVCMVDCGSNDLANLDDGETKVANITEGFPTPEYQDWEDNWE